MSKLSKSEPVYPHSILMQKAKDMREKNIGPEIYREVKVTNNGWCVVDDDLQSTYRCHVAEWTHFLPSESPFNESFVEKRSRAGLALIARRR
jgi:hypothetical protein